MNELYMFLLGGFFIIFVLPLLQGIAEIILTFLEVLRSEMSVTISKNNIKISQLSMSNDDGAFSPAIGFQIPDSDDEYTYDEDDDGGKI